MLQDNTEILNLIAPPLQVVPVVKKLSEVYKLWQSYLPHFPKTSRYTLGEKIDRFLVEGLEAILFASYAGKSEKLPHLKKGIAQIDLVKFFLQVSWEIGVLDNKKFIDLSDRLYEIGKMLNGWARQVSNLK